MKWEHTERCMCDECINKRTIAEMEARERKKASRPYLERRGGEIGSISVSDALKARNK